MSDETVMTPRQEDAIDAPPPPQDNGKGETAISGQVRHARDLIPVGDRGPEPNKYGQFIDIAKDVCKAYLMLPSHLHNNAAVMAGLLEIAARFQLSAYMLAGQTYVQNNRLCFQAQAFAAILYASGVLQGRLHFEFRGEGAEMTCTVTGRFKGDDTIYPATTPPLRLLHPGYSKKEGKQDMVAGSPLWDKDPEQQLAYFAQRRWIRRYAPDACMGMYTREEIIELDEYRANRTGGIPISADRLGQLETGEGWGEGAHVDADLASIDPETINFEDEEEPKKQASPARQAARGAPKTAKRAIVADSRKRPPEGRGRAGTGKGSKAYIKAAAARAEKGGRHVVAPTPKWLDYVVESEVWIKKITDPDGANQRWEKERDLRDKIRVPMGERSRLRAMIEKRIASLAK